MAAAIESAPRRRHHVTAQARYLAPGAGAPSLVFVSAGVHPETGRIFEVFLRGRGRVGSEIDFLYDDIAVLLSRLLRSGMAAGEIRALLAAPLDDGRPASVIAFACEQIAALQAEIDGGGAP